MLAAAEKSAQIKIALLSQLTVGKLGAKRDFDQLTHTNTTEVLKQGWVAEDVQLYLAQLEDTFVSQEVRTCLLSNEAVIPDSRCCCCWLRVVMRLLLRSKVRRTKART